MIYLDNAATTFQKPESVYSVLDEANRSFSVNAGRGSYALAKQASKRILDTKQLMKEIAEAPEVAEVVFTASATLAFNAIIGGFSWTKEDVVYVTPYEHNAVMRTLYAYQQKFDFQIEEIPLAKDLSIDLRKLRYLFSKQPPAYVFMNMVSNVTGYVLPYQEICEESAKYNAITILDGAQAFGCIPVSLQKVAADFVVFAGHKALCGPFGIGGYIMMHRKPLNWCGCLYGGTGSDSLRLQMPEGTGGLEPGSPNIVAIAGLEAALHEIQNKEVRTRLWKQENEMIGVFQEHLRKIQGLECYTAPNAENQVGILSVNITGYTAQQIGTILDEDFDIAVRTGYHCAPLIHKYLGNQDHVGTVRISIGRFTKETELEKAEAALLELAEG